MKILNVLYLLVLLTLLDGCSRSNIWLKEDKNEFLSKFNTGYSGYSWEFKTNDGKSDWQSSISLIENEYINPNIANINYEEFHELREILYDSRYVVMWFTKGWQEYYFDASVIQKAMDQGRIPVFLYWYFGDDFATKSAVELVEKKFTEYTAMNEKVVTFLNKLEGDVILIFEPEFNKQHILSSEVTKTVFIDTMEYSLNYFRKKISNNVNLKLGLSMNDNGSKYKDEATDLCGYEHCALGDKHTWNKSIDVFKSLTKNLDIAAFSLMLSPFSRGFENPDSPHKYENEKLGIGYLPQRIANLTLELHTQLNKPVFLSHLVMATGVWNDTNKNAKIEEDEVDPNGWNKEVYETYMNFDYNLFRKNGMFGLSLMNLFDDPKHDMGGYNYFLQNEHHLGVISTGADPESLSAKDGDLHFKTFNGVRLIDLIYKEYKKGQ